MKVAVYNDKGYFINQIPMYLRIYEKSMNTVVHKIKISTDNFYSDITDKGRIAVYFENIIYIETNGRKTRIHTYDENCLSHRTMRNHEELLADKTFFRYHEAYIVNLQYIRSIKGLMIFLRDGTKVPISKTRKASFIKTFTPAGGSKYGDYTSYVTV